MNPHSLVLLFKDKLKQRRNSIDKSSPRVIVTDAMFRNEGICAAAAEVKILDQDPSAQIVMYNIKNVDADATRG